MTNPHKLADCPLLPEISKPSLEDQIARANWRLTIDRLRRAYDAARSSFDAELISAREAFGGGNRYHVEAVESSLNLLKHSFALMLYHSWERQAVDWTNWKGPYKHDHTWKKVAQMGYAVSPGLIKLQKVANCIKHNSDKLWDQKIHRHMFEPILGLLIKKIDERNEEKSSGEKVKPDYARFLKISDEEMNEFFDSLDKSGPQDQEGG